MKGLLFALCLLPTVAAAIVWRADLASLQSEQVGEMQQVGKILYSPLQIFGGSCVLVSDQWVLTSRHGTEKWSAAFLHASFPALEVDKRYEVEQVHLHPKQDIALLKLKSSIKKGRTLPLFREKVRPNELARLGGFGMSGKAGAAGASGRFFTGHNRIDGLNKGQIFLSLSRPREENCEKDEAMLALFDSGSPLFLMRDGVWQLAGIASTATNGSNPNYGDRGSYARVSEVLAWMKSLMN